MSGAHALLKDAAWLREGVLARLMAMLHRDGEEARVVGGAVRNALLNAPVAEIDLATTALPEEVVRRAKAARFNSVPTGIEHGTVTVVIDSVPFEVTTLRQDVDTDGRHATVAFGRDWKADAKRRDFTVNALSATRDGTIYDYVGGLADIARRKLRFIGSPAMRIREDYLRILRFFRFHAAYGEGALDADGLHACIEARAGLEQLSRERVRVEILKLLVAQRAAPVLQAMTDAGLLGPLLAAVPNVVNFSAMAAVEAALSLPADPMRRLAALAVLVEEDAERLWRRLRLSNAEHAALSAMAQGWRRASPALDEQQRRALLYRLGAADFTNRMLLAWARSGAGPTAPGWQTLATLPRRWTPPVFPIRATDLMARGVAPGPVLGESLRTAEEAWISAGFPSAKDDLDAIAAAAAKA